MMMMIIMISKSYIVMNNMLTGTENNVFGNRKLKTENIVLCGRSQGLGHSRKVFKDHNFYCSCEVFAWFQALIDVQLAHSLRSSVGKIFADEIFAENKIKAFIWKYGWP